jgi:hypothetical protein
MIESIPRMYKFDFVTHISNTSHSIWSLQADSQLLKHHRRRETGGKNHSLRTESCASLGRIASLRVARQEYCGFTSGESRTTNPVPATCARNIVVLGHGVENNNPRDGRLRGGNTPRSWARFGLGKAFKDYRLGIVPGGRRLIRREAPKKWIARSPEVCHILTTWGRYLGTSQEKASRSFDWRHYLRLADFVWTGSYSKHLYSTGYSKVFLAKQCALMYLDSL